MLLEQFENSMPYDEIVRIAKNISYGKIITNRRGLPILYRHPYMSDCLILGYKPNTDEIAFAESINVGTGEKTRWDAEKVKERYNDFESNRFEITVSAKSATVQEFVQQFLLLNGFTWANDDKTIKHVDGLTQVICGLWNDNVTKKRIAYSTAQQDDEIPFDTFWNAYFRF